MEVSMSELKTWLAGSPLGSAFKAFLAVVIAAAIADFVNLGNINMMNWETWVIAGLASSTPVAINWLNPSDPRYGKTTGK